MKDRRILWYRGELPAEAFPTRFSGCRFEDAETEQGLSDFISTHARAYGQRVREGDRELYELDLEDGVIERDKTFTLFRDGEPMGCITYTVHRKPDGGEALLLGNAGVPGELQGRGLGMELYARLMNLLAGLHPPGTTVLADLHNGNVASRRIVEKLGLRQVEVESWFPVAGEGK